MNSPSLSAIHNPPLPAPAGSAAAADALKFISGAAASSVQSAAAADSDAFNQNDSAEADDLLLRQRQQQPPSPGAGKLRRGCFSVITVLCRAIRPSRFCLFVATIIGISCSIISRVIISGCCCHRPSLPNIPSHAHAVASVIHSL